MSSRELNTSSCRSGGSLVNDGNSEIVLTKYAHISLDTNPELLGQVLEQEARRRADEEGSKLDKLSGNKLWTVPMGERLASKSSKQFQVVWSDLSFHVDASIYEKTIDGLIKTTEAISAGFKFGCGAKKRKSNAESLKHQLGPSSGSKRTIFENLNGYLNSGEISAILGPSGAGKTSLLNALSGRTENYGGCVKLVGAGQQKRMRMCIIPQKDYLIESLTVRENLLYSSKILNAQEDFDHEANIVRVVKMLNLTTCFNSPASNISGGEYKRVSIAQELLRQPDILVLDEPTSGLDSLNCKNLIRSLAGLIEASERGQLQPMAIVLSIHQPDVEIFHMFHHVYCMARGGRVIFDGHPRDVLQTVQAHAGLECSVQEDVMHPTINPANLLIEIASESIYGQAPIDRLARLQRKQSEAASSPADSRRLQMDLDTSSNASTEEHRNKSTNSLVHEASLAPISNSSSSDDKSEPSKMRKSQLVRDKRLQVKNDHSGRFWYHTRLLTSRAFVATLRDPFITLVSLVYHLSIPFVMWTVYPSLIGSINACPTIIRDLDMISIANNQTAARMADLVEELSISFESSTMFFLTFYAFSMCALTVSSLAFPLNMHILLKEVRNGWYNLSSYVLAKTLANFPFEVIFPSLSLVMIYLMLDMPESEYNWRMLGIGLVMTLITMISQTQGLIFGALCMDSVQTAIFLASSSSLPQALLSGFTARVRRMPWALQQFSWISQYRYSTDLINIIRFGFGICPCDERTDDYLRTHKPAFTDVPNNLNSVLTYYIKTNNNTDEDEPADSDSPSALVASSRIAANASEHLASTMNSIVNQTTVMLLGGERLPGIDYSLTLNESQRASTLELIDKGKINLLANMAEMSARALTYGRSIEDCSAVRSELLIVAGTLPDSYLGSLFGGMSALLVVCKILLFLVVRAKVGSRI